MASKPKKGAADEVAKLVARYGWKAVKQAEALAIKNFENRTMGEKRISKKILSKKARKYTERNIKENNRFSRYAERAMQRIETVGNNRPLPKYKKKGK